MSIPLESFPEIGVEIAYRNGWRQLWKHFLMLFIIGIIAFLISLPSFAMDRALQEIEGAAAAGLFFLSMAYAAFLTKPIDYGVAFVFLKAARDDPVDIRDMFEGLRDYWNVVLANVVVTVVVGFGFILLIVPGIMFACKLAFTPYLVMDRKMRVMEALQESWHMTTGHAWKVFFTGLLAIPIFVAGLICLIVGVIFSVMWIRLAFASLYHAIESAEEGPVEE